MTLPWLLATRGGQGRTADRQEAGKQERSEQVSVGSSYSQPASQAAREHRSMSWDGGWCDRGTWVASARQADWLRNLHRLAIPQNELDRQFSLSSQNELALSRQTIKLAASKQFLCLSSQNELASCLMTLCHLETVCILNTDSLSQNKLTVAKHFTISKQTRCLKTV